MRISPRHVGLTRSFSALNLAFLCAHQQQLQTHLSGCRGNTLPESHIDYTVLENGELFIRLSDL